MNTPDDLVAMSRRAAGQPSVRTMLSYDASQSVEDIAQQTVLSLLRWPVDGDVSPALVRSVARREAANAARPAGLTGVEGARRRRMLAARLGRPVEPAPVASPVGGELSVLADTGRLGTSPAAEDVALPPDAAIRWQVLSARLAGRLNHYCRPNTKIHFAAASILAGRVPSPPMSVVDQRALSALRRAADDLVEGRPLPPARPAAHRTETFEVAA